MKYCTTCKIRKPLDDFYNDKSRPSGKHPLCKTCKNERKNAYRQNNRHVEYPGANRRYRALAEKRGQEREIERLIMEVWPESPKPKDPPYPINVERRKDLEAAFITQHDPVLIKRARKIGRSTAPYSLRLTRKQEAAMWDMYALRDYHYAKSGETMVVDHIVPLAGVNVCGLNVPWNLQVVPEWYNRYKGNKMEKGQNGWGPDWSFEEVEPPSVVFQEIR